MTYQPMVGPLIAALGFGLQWARAFKGFADMWLGPIGVVAGLLAFWLTHPITGDWREWVLNAVLALFTYVPAMLGGTALAVSASSRLSVVPATNSK